MPGRGGHRSTTPPPTRASPPTWSAARASRSARTRPSRPATTPPAFRCSWAGLYELTGGVHERLARLVLALIGTLAVLFAYLIGRRLAGPLAGLIGAGAVAIYPALLEYQGMLMGEPLAATLLSGAVLAMLWASRQGEGGGLRRRWVSRLGGDGRPSRGWGEKQDAASARDPHPRLVAMAGSGTLAWGAGADPAGVPGDLVADCCRGLRARGSGRVARLPASGGGHARRAGDSRRAVDGPQRDRAGPVRADLDRRRPGPLRRLLPAVRRRSRTGRAGGAGAPSGPDAPPGGRILSPRSPFVSHSATNSERRTRPWPDFGSSRSSPRWRRSATRAWKATRHWHGWGANGCGTRSAKNRSTTSDSSPPRYGGSGGTGRAT